MQALYFNDFGGPEVLRYGELPTPLCTPGTAIVRTTAIGLNFADIYRRRGAYHLAGNPPYIAGYEAAGTIDAVGADAPAWATPGARVAFADSPFANATHVRVPYDHLITLPDDISEETAAASLLQGLTAQFLSTQSYAIHSGDRVVVHAAAGGVGLFLVQLAKQRGAHVLAFASSEEKREAARALGAHEVFGYDAWPTAAQGADVVYDSIGTTLDASLDVVRTGGTVVFFGFAGGAPPLIDPRRLMDGSKHLVGGDLWNVLTTHEERMRQAHTLFGLIRSGTVQPVIARRFPLAAGVEAHRFLESRAAIGKVLLVP